MGVSTLACRARCSLRFAATALGTYWTGYTARETRQVVSACVGGLINAHLGQLQLYRKHGLVLEFVLHRRSRPWKCPRVQGWCQQSRSSHDRLGPATPFLVDECTSPVAAVSYASTALAVYSLYCASGVCAALAPSCRVHLSSARGELRRTRSTAARSASAHTLHPRRLCQESVWTGMAFLIHSSNLGSALPRPCSTGAPVQFAKPVNYGVCYQTDSARVNRSTNLSVDKSCPSIFAALGAANPHGLDDCPNSVLPAGFDMRGSVDIPCLSSVALVAADPPGFSCCLESSRRRQKRS